MTKEEVLLCILEGYGNMTEDEEMENQLLHYKIDYRIKKVKKEEIEDSPGPPFPYISTSFGPYTNIKKYAEDRIAHDLAEKEKKKR